MPKPLKDEIRAVVALLEAEHEDVEELAIQVIQALDEVRAPKTRFAIISQIHADDREDGYAFHVTGPFNTIGQAQKALQKGLIAGSAPGKGEAYRWARLSTPRAAELALEAADEDPKRAKEKAGIPHGHPAPIPADDIKARKRHLALSKDAKIQAFKEAV